MRFQQNDTMFKIQLKNLGAMAFMTTFDSKIRPQDDIFGYVNNKWIDRNPIPADQCAWGNFHILNDKSTKKVKKIINDLLDSREIEISHDEKLLRDYFTAAINFSKNKSRHIKTIEQEVTKINDIKSLKMLSYYLGYAHSIGIDSFWQSVVDLDDKNSKSHIMRIQQSGLNLPNRDYYLEKDKRFRDIRNEYERYFNSLKKYLPKILQVDYRVVYKIEFALAKLSWTDVELRNIEKCYNNISTTKLCNRFPNIDWDQYLLGLGCKKSMKHVVVDQLSFISGVSNMLNTVSLDEIKQYLVWDMVNKYSSWLSSKSAQIKFDFYGKVLSGRTKNAPIWKRAIYLSDELMIGEIIGRQYVKENFPKSSKLKVLSLVEDIRLAYHKRIETANWLSKGSKQIAHRKLDNIRVFIGYPPKWHSFSKLEFSNNNHIDNIIKANRFDCRYSLSRIGKAPESEDWHIFPHIVNAYHDPNQLVICFPAAILKPPYFNPNSSYEENIGGIGAIIGHELTHGFDDQGSKFDEHGNVITWQKAIEKKRFDAIAQKIIDQANKYEVIPNTFLKGKLIIGEAIADIGGVELAIEALKFKFGKNNLERKLKKLFLNYARCECGIQRDEYTLQIVKTDPHPVSKFRVNCVLSHVNDFYTTFSVKDGDRLYLPPESRAHIW